MPELVEKPGLLFVLATLLPIFSFGLLLLTASLRWGMRPYVKDHPGVKTVFDLLGGEVTGRGPAYVALGAIALAFVCSLTGFIWFLSEVNEMHHLEEHLLHEKIAHAEPHGHKHDAKKKDAIAEKKVKEAKAEKHVQDVGRLNALRDHWEDKVDW